MSRHQERLESYRQARELFPDKIGVGVARRILCMSDHSVRNHCIKGDLYFEKLGNRYRFMIEWIIDFAEVNQLTLNLREFK